MFTITNFKEHPSNPLYIVFKFKTKEQSLMFQEKLKKENIFFETDSAENSYGELFLVAVKNKDEKRATLINYEVLGVFRKPFIENKLFRNIIIAFTFFVIAMAIYGAVISR